MTYKAVGIHVFAGLFTEGVKEHFEVPAVINDGYGDNIHIANHPEAKLFKSAEFNPEEFDNIDFVYSQPPCAPWSVSGNKKGLDDPRISMTTDAAKIGLSLKPRFFALESVVPAFTKGRAYYDKLGDLWRECGYNVTHMLINGIYSGTPQIRHRYLFIAHQGNLDFPDFTKPKTVNESFIDIKPGGYEICGPGVKNTLDKFGYKEIPQGTNLFKWFTRINKNPQYKSNGHMLDRPARSSIRLNGFKPAPVFFGDYSWLHPTEDRPITMNELKALCGLRQDYNLLNEGRAAAQVLLGKSVMPKTGAWIAKMAKKTINNKTNIIHPEVIDLRNGEFEPLMI